MIIGTLSPKKWQLYRNYLENKCYNWYLYDNYNYKLNSGYLLKIFYKKICLYWFFYCYNYLF